MVNEVAVRFRTPAALGDDSPFAVRVNCDGGVVICVRILQSFYNGGDLARVVRSYRRTMVMQRPWVRHDWPGSLRPVCALGSAPTPACRRRFSGFASCARAVCKHDEMAVRLRCLVRLLWGVLMKDLPKGLIILVSGGVVNCCKVELWLLRLFGGTGCELNLNLGYKQIVVRRETAV